MQKQGHFLKIKQHPQQHWINSFVVQNCFSGVLWVNQKMQRPLLNYLFQLIKACYSWRCYMKFILNK